MKNILVLLILAFGLFGCGTVDNVPPDNLAPHIMPCENCGDIYFYVASDYGDCELYFDGVDMGQLTYRFDYPSCGDGELIKITAEGGNHLFRVEAIGDDEGRFSQDSVIVVAGGCSVRGTVNPWDF